MRSILLPVSGSATETSAIQLAVRIASRYESHIHGLYVRPLPPIVAGEGITVPGDYVARIAEEGKEAGARAYQQFASSMKDAGFTVGDRMEDAASNVPTSPRFARFSEMDGVESQLIGEMGRAHDLILLDRRDGATSVDWKAASEAALFESGRPLLLAGREASTDFARRILIAWNGSTETARVLAMGHELIRQADAVSVLTVEGAMVPGPDGQQICDYLKHNGIDATLMTKPSGSIGAGEMILEYAAEWGADLILKGAFTHSRLRQMIFGGPTSYIMDSSALPVLFAH